MNKQEIISQTSAKVAEENKRLDDLDKKLNAVSMFRKRAKFNNPSEIETIINPNFNF